MQEILNAKCGEIDIIAKDKEELVFIEVKTRSQKIYGRPADSIDKKKKKHIYHTAEYYMLINRLENKFCRIDVIEVYFCNATFKINHLKNCILERPYRKNIYEGERDVL